MSDITEIREALFRSSESMEMACKALTDCPTIDEHDYQACKELIRVVHLRMNMLDAQLSLKKVKVLNG